MTDDLGESRRFWDAHAERDPLWAVLSEPGKEGRKWDVRRFFQTGVNEIALTLYELASHGINVTHGDALDFGCGVGRVTQALAPQFERVVGVDVSSRMIDMATALNRFPDRTSYVWNDAPHLAMFGDDTVDFIYTNLVLQHIVPELTRGYLREFIRLLRPSGILVFQLPSHPRTEEDPLPEFTVAPMPDDAYQASLSLASVPRGPIGCSAEITLDVDVTNVSPVPWSRRDFGTITVGNHWLDHTGTRMLQRDDGRTLLPETVPPGGTCRVPLTVTTPPSEGQYQCEVDLAHEGVRWFGDKDSAVVRFQVAVRVGGEPETAHKSTAPPEPADRAGRAARIGLPSAAPGDPSVADPGIFPIHGVHTDVVGQLIAAGGAELLHRVGDQSCGPTWVSYRYFARKATSPVTRGRRVAGGGWRAGP